MAFKDFPANQYVKTFETNELVRMGSFQTNENGELKYIRALMYIRGNLAGNEQFRIRLFPTNLYETSIATSSWMSLSNIVDENNIALLGNFVGMIRCDFNRENINKNNTYYVQAELQNYTANYPTFEIGLAYDFPGPRYAIGETKFYKANLAFEIFTYREYGQ